MKRLYAPWRSEYATKISREKKVKTSSKDCVFCTIIKEKKDEKNFVLKRYKSCILMLNRYPYNAGHLLVLPIAHKKDLTELDASARAEIMEVMANATEMVQKFGGAHGINIGMNLGKAAGAGIPSHLHVHILPRYNGDTNFLPLLADTKQVSFDLHKVYDVMKTWF